MLTYKILIINRASIGTDPFITSNNIDVLEIDEQPIGILTYTNITCLIPRDVKLNYTPLGKLKVYLKLQLPMSGIMPGMV